MGPRPKGVREESSVSGAQEALAPWRRGYPVGPMVVDTAVPEAECRRGAREEVLTVFLFLPSTLPLPIVGQWVATWQERLGDAVYKSQDRDQEKRVENRE